VIVDLDGLFQHPIYVSGPQPLSRAAMEAIRQWRSEPPHINGAPIARAAIVQVTFKE
jgi:outer membrane biosynthesis protein TonB